MGAGEWTIRPASAEEAETVLDLWRRAGSLPTATDSEDALRALLAHDPESLLLALAEGGAIGSLIAAWDGWRGNFYRLAVDPGWRRRGLATALLREGERRLRARGAVRFTAIVAATENEALGFWLSSGYEQQRERERFVRVSPG